MLTETISTNLLLLEYSPLWIDYGVLSIDDLTNQIDEFKSGEDTNKEHYRYRTLQNFIKKNSSIDNSTLNKIIELLNIDKDPSMSASATLELLRTKYLTEQQFEQIIIFLKTFGDWTTKYIDKIKLFKQDN